MQKTLEQYFRDALDAGAIDHSLRCSIGQDGRMRFYIHPARQGGDTCNYVVEGDNLGPDPEIRSL